MKAVAVRAPVLTIAVLFGGIVLAGCAKKAVEAPPRLAATPPAAASAHVQEKSAPAPTAAPATTPPQAPTLEAGDLKDVFFDFDKSDLRDDARAALDLDSKLLREHPHARIRIEGHCDERGTVAYNIALGEHRADAVKEYLVAAGVSASQVAIISYGKERPFCDEHNEACWAKNRCGHMVLQPGPA
jgi:peptidoglycan-associated lipoprotein